MPYEIILAPEAVEDFDGLKAAIRSSVKVALDYDITDTNVEVLAIVPKSAAEKWLAQFGKPELKK